jgi:hypothetical protein
MEWQVSQVHLATDEVTWALGYNFGAGGFLRLSCLLLARCPISKNSEGEGLCRQRIEGTAR